MKILSKKIIALPKEKVNMVSSKVSFPRDINPVRRTILNIIERFKRLYRVFIKTRDIRKIQKLHPNSDMILIKGGTYSRSIERRIYTADTQFEIRDVTISDFNLGRHQVTQEQFQAVMGFNPSYFRTWEPTRGTHISYRKPVERVDWYMANVYCLMLTYYLNMHDQDLLIKIGEWVDIVRNNTIGTGAYKRAAESFAEWSMTESARAFAIYRLPTEDELKIAASSGDSPGIYKYAGSDDIDSVAWYKDNSNATTHRLGQKSPNELGFYDMSGNVWEWCVDGQLHIVGETGRMRFPFLCGGSWYSSAEQCELMYRSFYDPRLPVDRRFGLRVVKNEVQGGVGRPVRGEGYIKDERGNSIGGVKVEVYFTEGSETPNLITQTRNSGYFSYMANVGNPYKLVFSKEGYKTEERTGTIVDEQPEITVIMTQE